ncbi:MAG: hypothetical protein FWE71_00660 [Nocardioidaceae bacterium]|nr:hypothetical protein [Nocardioidaceae bacterium]MCL2612677.1 hypothetical protein [Nocardioidaceae bacterium]
MDNAHAPLLPAAAPIPPRRGITFASVPQILLGLGAFCLLVAAAIFLAVSWSALGVGGRTAVLAVLTLTAVASTLALHLRGLRFAAEALSVVSLGLLTLDVYGAAAAGLLDGMPDGRVTLLAGVLLAIGGWAFSLSPASAGTRLKAPQVAIGIGLGLAYLGGAVSGHPLTGGNLAALLGAGLAARSRRSGLPVQQWSCLAGAAVGWTGATTTAVAESLGTPTLHQMWVVGSGWSLLVSAAVLLVPALVLRAEAAFLAGASGAALLATGAVTIPVVGSSPTVLTAVALGTTAAWTLLLAVRDRIRLVAVAPVSIGALFLAGALIDGVGVDLARWTRIAGPFSKSFLVTVRGRALELAPALLVPSALVVLTAAVLGLAGPRPAHPRRWLALGTLVAGCTGALTAAAYDVPLTIATGLAALTALVAAALAVRGEDALAPAYTWIAVGVAILAAVASLPSASLTATVAGSGLVTALVLTLLGRTERVRIPGEAALVPAAALGTAGTVMAVGDEPAWIAVPVLLAVGVVAIARPVARVEVPAVVAALASLLVSVIAATDPLGLISLWLLVIGGLCCASALLHAQRRPLAAAGGLLWMVAIWTRLFDQHVAVVEAYTLPLAVALLAVGLLHLHRRAGAGTDQALLPGLALATIPSLLLVLGDPVSLRSLLLGTACLVLVLAGATMRWSAPVLAGTAVGVVLVLRELGPYAGTVPQWVWIGLAGVLLTVTGITWERRLRDLRRAAGLIGRLR